MLKAVLLSIAVFLLILPDAQADISITIDSETHKAKIHIQGETITSVLKYYHQHFGTTASLSASLAQKHIDADLRGASLLMLTQRLLRTFNVALIADDSNSIRHISLLPDGKGASLMEIGDTSSVDKHFYRQVFGGAVLHSPSGYSYRDRMRHNGRSTFQERDEKVRAGGKPRSREQMIKLQRMQRMQRMQRQHREP